MNMQKKTLLLIGLLLIVLFALTFPGTALAGPGGKVASAIAKTWWGKLLIGVLVIVLAPVIIYVMAKEKLASNRTKKVLSQLARMNPAFRWTTLNARAHAIVTHVYRAWSKADVEQASDWMTHWYWQNQKLTVLEDWEEEGLVNYCKLKDIEAIKPLYVDYSEHEPGDGEDSRIAVLVEMKVQDYLEDKQTGKIVEGDKKFKYHEAVWTLMLQNGNWKLDLIEDSAMSLTYAGMQSSVQEAAEHLSSGLIFQKGVQSEEV